MEKFIKDTIKEAGKIVLEGFESELEISTKKHDRDFVTQYDNKVEDYIVGKIQSTYPEAGILAEESGEIKKADKFFVIDPIDGTGNFTRRIPLSCVIIGYVESDQVSFGAVYDPYRDELFYAERGKGAELNGKPIRVMENSNGRQLSGHLIAIDTYFPGTVDRYKGILETVSTGLDLKNFTLGSVGLNLVYAACGRLDLSGGVGFAPWDLVGPSIILEEAGAVITDVEGNPYRWDSQSLITANLTLHKKIIGLIHG